jgi:hypothetical protein
MATMGAVRGRAGGGVRGLTCPRGPEAALNCKMVSFLGSVCNLAAVIIIL